MYRQEAREEYLQALRLGQRELKTMTAAFVAGMALILVIAVFVGATQFIKTSGMREKNTVAMTVGSNELSNAELNYFYIDAVNNFYSQNGSYASIFGLDVTQPLNKQTYDETTGAFATGMVGATMPNPMGGAIETLDFIPEEERKG